MILIIDNVQLIIGIILTVLGIIIIKLINYELHK
jgi:hypothetical protein